MEDNDLKQYEKEEHIDYVRKVLGIVSVQMTFTFVLCILASASAGIGSFFKHPMTLVFAVMLLICCACTIFISKEYRTRVPLNYVLLAGATLGEAFFLAAVAADLKEASVFGCIMATCFAVGGLFLASLKTASSMDRERLVSNMVTAMIGTLILHIIVIVVFMFGFGIKDKALVLGISCLMLVISGAYVMFALLFIIVPGLEDKDDYILGALRLYLEIARLFYWMMKILGEKK